MKTKYYLFLIVLLILAACTTTQKKVPIPELKRVKVALVQSREISFPIRTSGYVASSKEIKLAFKTGGILGSINADEGREVRQGDVLAVLNLSEIQAQVKLARNGYEKTLRDFNRAKNLYQDSVATLEQYQNAETALNMARSSLDVAEFNLQHSRITAPEQGTILRRFAEPGEVIGAGYPVFLFGTKGKHWKVKAGLSDRDFIRISPGDSAIVTMDTYPGEKFHAKVSQVTEAANPMTGTYGVELDLEDTPLRLASGFVARVELFPFTRESFYMIPVEALVEAEGETAYVFTLTEGKKARKIRVIVPRMEGAQVAVSKGLEGIREVVTEGAAYLAEGDSVIVIQ
jgi:multidrug efflux system membrane fusion protein